MDSPDFDGLLLNFDCKISNVCGKLALLYLHNTQNNQDCTDLNNVLSEIQFMLITLNNLLQQQEELLECQTKRIDNLISLLHDQTDHIEAKLSILDSM